MPKYPASLLLGLLLMASGARAQDVLADLALAEQSHAVVSDTAPPKKLKPILRYNPFYWAANGTLTFYQTVISPQISADCLFELSCSRFSREAIRRFGLIKGVALSADRISRCNRLSATSLDPVRANAAGKSIDTPDMYQKTPDR
ncbi:membrane protein insertion efficiency factor YidD [Siphonobacter aquaeclarae]|uniref:Haemolytic domain-containing protein n=1 Tax=Siphonobacter aquaeclarae TaxID=563176 RepID=A0A1G9LEL4_9BACT|nr:membrane protein insertion efficiency factor YidD [Siphonobacter aquaeclarae]SDL60381.1 Haemolytic domain-containing protein [Siphonobacter aquaeclarae]